MTPKMQEKRDEMCPNYVISGAQGIRVDELCKSAWRYGFNAAHDLMLEEIKPLVEALDSCRAAMIYAYEDHIDQYYLNVKAQVEAALDKIKGEK